MTKFIIIGKANVGKSTFFNCILGENFSPINKRKDSTRIFLSKYIKNKFLLIDSPGINFNKKLSILNLDNFLFKNANIVIILDLLDINFIDFLILDLLLRINKKIIIILNKKNKLSNFYIKNFILSIKKNFNIDNILEFSKNNLKQIIQIRQIFFKLSENKLYRANLSNDSDLKDNIYNIIFSCLLNKYPLEIPYRIKISITSKIINKFMRNLSIELLLKKKSQFNIIVGSRGIKIKNLRLMIKRKLNFLLPFLNYINIFLIVK